MANAACNNVSAFDVEASLTDFISDAKLAVLELPSWLSGEQRKEAKKAADSRPELQCESFGFGAERRLHIFKQVKIASMGSHGETVGVKNTFIDDWIARANALETPSKDIAFWSLPAPAFLRSPTNVSGLQLDPQRPNLFLIDVDTDDNANKENVYRADVCKLNASSPPPSTCVSFDGFSSPRTPSVISQTPSPNQGNPYADDREIQIRHTFIHFDDLSDASVDSRIVQSMPDGMFRQCLHVDNPGSSVSAEPAPSVQDETLPMLATPSPTRVRQATSLRECLLAPATNVIIEGLLKAPKFNGMCGVVQSYDEKSGRYDVLISGSNQLAKVKAEHLRLRSPCASAGRPARAR